MRVTGVLCLLFGVSATALAGDLPCPGNLNGDCTVGASDLAILLGNWGPCPDPCTPDATCAADFDADCTVGAADLAVLLGGWGSCPGHPVNDLPECAIEIFDGDTDFDNTNATTDPILAPGCQFFSNLPRVDVWFDYTATCDGLLKVCTCDQVPWDTTLVLYEGCENPVTSDRQVACNDDAICALPTTSRMVTVTTAGTCYKIRVGGWDESEFGPGTLTVACLEGKATSNCCSPHPEPGCDDAACEAIICSDPVDPFCCNQEHGQWDDACVTQALFWCDICSGGC